MTNVTQLQALYDSWIAADRAWMDAIESAHPREWPGDVRYTSRGKGEPGSALRAAHDTFTAARDAFHAAGGSEWLQGRYATRAEKRSELRNEIANTGDC
jgi:hypothetical protein